MAIDPNIALGYKGIQLESPLNQYAQVAQIQGAQNQNALAQFQLKSAQRGEQDTEALRNALAGTKYGTPEYDQALTGAFLKTGNVKGLQEYQKGQRETEKSAAELAVKQQELKRSIFGNLAMNPSDENVKAHLQDMLIQKQMTPQEADGWQSKVATMNPTQRTKFFTDLAQTADQRVGHDVTMRGQNMVDARAKDRLAQDAQAVTYQQDANGNMIALPSKIAPGIIPTAKAVIAPGGGMTPLQGKDSSKTAVSEQQAAYNIGRILNAAKQINTVVKTDPSAIQPGAMEAGFNAVGMKGTANASRNADRQIVSGAQRDALDAMLYLATGAAYNKEQLEGQMEAYIPQYTDKPERVASKQLMMNDLIQSAKVRAGKAWTPEMEQTVQSLMNSSAPAAPASAGGAASNTVVTPDGQSHTFPTAAAAAQFKKAAGL